MTRKKKIKKILIEVGILVSITLATLLLFVVFSEQDPTREERSRYVNEVNNNRDYEWYIDQTTTGKYWDVNCAVATIVMAGKWYDKDFNTSVRDYREHYVQEKRGLYASDQRIFLKSEGIPFTEKRYGTVDDMLKPLDEGNILLAAVDMGRIVYNDKPDSRIGKYGRLGMNSFHAFVIKGYVYLDEVLYFIVYDPANQAEYYSDNTPKGKDRLFNADEVGTAISLHERAYFVILNEDMN